MLKGSDLSEFQSASIIPRSDEDFWFVRCADGTGHMDKAFDHHVATAKQNNIFVGPYLFCRASQDANAQAAILCQHWQPGMINPALDFEVFDGKTPEYCVEWLDDACAMVTKTINKPAIIYTGPGIWNEMYPHFDAKKHEAIDASILWLASWRISRPQHLNPWFSKGRELFWQNNNSGGAGSTAAHPTDDDRFFGSHQDLANLCATPQRHPNSDFAMWHWLRYTWIPQHYAKQYWGSAWAELTANHGDLGKRIYHEQGPK